MKLNGCHWILLTAILHLGTLSLESRENPRARWFSGEKKTKVEKPTPAAPIPKRKRSRFRGPKHVEIDLTQQELRAYEGGRVVLRTHISSGRNGATPTGHFKAGWKDADHHSSLFNNAPMPWSVQVHGDIFVHGFSSVPDYPASHGCIRVPLTGNNPAKRFFEWVEAGTPIRIVP